MKLPRRNFLHLAAGAATLPALLRVAWAQAYPSRPITVIVPFAAGGSSDVIARIVGEHMSRTLGQQFIRLVGEVRIERDRCGVRPHVAHLYGIAVGVGAHRSRSILTSPTSRMSISRLSAWSSSSR